MTKNEYAAEIEDCYQDELDGAERADAERYVADTFAGDLVQILDSISTDIPDVDGIGQLDTWLMGLDRRGSGLQYALDADHWELVMAANNSFHDWYQVVIAAYSRGAIVLPAAAQRKADLMAALREIAEVFPARGQ